MASKKPQPAEGPQDVHSAFGQGALYICGGNTVCYKGESTNSARCCGGGACNCMSKTTQHETEFNFAATDPKKNEVVVQQPQSWEIAQREVLRIEHEKQIQDLIQRQEAASKRDDTL